MARRSNNITAYFSRDVKIVDRQPEQKSADGKHVVGYNKAWETEFSWLVPVYTKETVSGMLCSVCKWHSTKSKYNKSSMWSDTPWVSLHKDVVRRHSTSIQHQDAIQREIYREAAERDGGIAQALELEVCLEKKAVKGAMQCLY